MSQGKKPVNCKDFKLLGGVEFGWDRLSVCSGKRDRNTQGGYQTFHFYYQRYGSTKKWIRSAVRQDWSENFCFYSMMLFLARDTRGNHPRSIAWLLSMPIIGSEFRNRFRDRPWLSAQSKARSYRPERLAKSNRHVALIHYPAIRRPINASEAWDSIPFPFRPSALPPARAAVLFWSYTVEPTSAPVEPAWWLYRGRNYNKRVNLPYVQRRSIKFEANNRLSNIKLSIVAHQSEAYLKNGTNAMTMPGFLTVILSKLIYFCYIQVSIELRNRLNIFRYWFD